MLTRRRIKKWRQVPSHVFIECGGSWISGPFGVGASLWKAAGELVGTVLGKFRQFTNPSKGCRVSARVLSGKHPKHFAKF